MSEATTDENTPPDYGAADFLRFMDGKGISLKCPCCGQANFSFDEERNGASTAIIKLNRTNPEIFGASVGYTVAVFCNNCGYIMQFLRRTMEQWRAENK